MSVHDFDEWYSGKEITTPNGIRLWAKQLPSVDQYYIGLGVPVGSDCDPVGQPGLAHFLEHIAFHGGQRFAGQSSRQDYLTPYCDKPSAATTRQQTVYELSVSPELLLRGLEVLPTLLFDIGFRNINIERSVIRQERYNRLCHINMMAAEIVEAVATNNPTWQPLVIGSEDGLSAINAESLRAFHQDWYQGGNTYGVIVGPRSEDTMLDAFSQALSWVPKEPSTENMLPIPIPIPGGASVTRHWSEWDANFNNSALAYSIALPEDVHTRHLACLAATLLGPPLHRALIEESGLVYQIDIKVNNYRGMNTLSFTTFTQKDRIGLVRKYIEQTLLDQRLYRDDFRLTQQKTLNAIGNDGADVCHIGSEKLEAMLDQRDISGRNEYFAAVQGLTSDDLLEFAHQYLTPKSWRVIEITP